MSDAYCREGELTGASSRYICGSGDGNLSRGELRGRWENRYSSGGLQCQCRLRELLLVSLQKCNVSELGETEMNWSIVRGCRMKLTLSVCSIMIFFYG